MKEVLVIVLTTIITLFITLFVLWRLDIIYLNFQQTIERGKEVIGQDELSQLMQLKYPRLGEDIQTAYTLFGEPAFESDGQKDFHLLENQKSLYVGYDVEQDKEIIELVEINLDGDKDKILSIGERFLPVGSSFIKETQSEEEDRNETFRYTSIDYTESYYYEVPGERNYAFIRISYRESDLHTEPKETITYSLEASFISEQDLRYEIGMEQEQAAQAVEETNTSQQVSEQNNPEEPSYEQQLTEQSSSTNLVEEPDIKYKDSSSPSFSEEAIQENNGKVKEPEFLSLASQGKINGINDSLYTSIGLTIDNHMGVPNWRIETDGGYILMYTACHCGFVVGYDYEEYPDEPISSYYLPISLSREEIIQYLGEPSSEGVSEVDSGYYLYYELEDYSLYVETDEGDFSFGPFRSITLK